MGETAPVSTEQTPQPPDTLETLVGEWLTVPDLSERLGVRLADVRGYSYNRRDVTGRVIANAYAQTLGAIFTEQGTPAADGLTPEAIATNRFIDTSVGLPS